VTRPVDGITLAQAGKILGVARSTVQEWVSSGRLPVHGQPGESRRLSQADVEQLAAAVYAGDAGLSLLEMAGYDGGNAGGDKGGFPYVVTLFGYEVLDRLRAAGLREVEVGQ